MEVLEVKMQVFGQAVIVKEDRGGVMIMKDEV